MRKFPAFCFLSLFFSCLTVSARKPEPLMYPNLSSDAIDDKRIDFAIGEYLDSLPEVQKISQIFLINVGGNSRYEPNEDSSEIDAFTGTSNEPLVPGGFILFGYNIPGTPEETVDFLSSIARWCEDNSISRPYIAVDQEGGYVARLRKLNSTLPSSENVSQKLSVAEAYELYSLQARQMRALGFDMNLAPVSETVDDGNRDFLDTRSYGNTVQAISYSIACVSAYQKNGVGAVLKHFPGNTNTDPHSGLPEIGLSKSELEDRIIRPFFFTLSSSPSAVLMSHARTSAVDPEKPASLSSVWVGEKLKGELSYRGLILSDDIFMGALSKNGFPADKAAINAINAGVHVIMLSDKKFGAVAGTLLEHATEDENFRGKLREAEKKVLAFKIECGILSLEKNPDGSYRVTEVSDLKQNGSRDERLEKFRKSRSEGQAMHEKFFR